MAEETAGQLIDGASSPSSSTFQESEYQVFLNFRGEDTRKNFTDHLYCYLKDAGIRTFRDKEELHVGKEIGAVLLRAIERATVSIPIFSRGYASSKWCLMELTQMVKCMKSNNGRHTICPIFYDVTPSEVKHQTESYQEAFLKHTKTCGGPIVEEWKDALKQVAELKGWEKDKVADGHEGELIKIIVTEVCRMLKRSHVSLPVNLVGMDHHLEEMTKLLDIKSDNGVRIVGIIGMGGIGKTTIAKYIYNQICDNFEQQCTFLEDVKENVVRKGYAELQKVLISAVLKRTLDGITVDINMLKDKKVLIVLDDVKDRLQLDKIIRSRDCFGSGSRIIVTSRNQDVFLDEEGVPPYEPNGMDLDDSLLLFSKHAFRNTQPSEGFEDISRQLAQSAAGLPLSLVVIGSMLYKKKKTIWEETLKKLKDIPLEEVFERLKISYDALGNGHKQIFLDIACHFIGEDKTLPFYMWEDCKFYPETGIDTLINLSLVTLKDESVFRMHDQLRDLGRHIVYQENPSDLGKRSMLWSHKEAEEVLNNRSGTEIVETFYMKFGWVSDCICISNDDLKGLSRLRYLHLDSSTLKGDFKGLVSNLRWFTAPLHSGKKKSKMPITNFCANKLVILDLSKSDISDGWESLIQIKAATNLKVINLSSCRYLTKLPECLWNMKSLVELNLSDTGITELSEHGIGNLTNLTKLLLCDSKMKRLPDAIGKLEKLRVLDCSGCRSFEGEVPSGIGSNLRKLNLSHTRITKLPGVAIERLQNLEELKCSGCESLEGPLPKGIWSLSSLRVLSFWCCYKINGGLPKDISGMSHLETLNLGYCENLRYPTEGLKLPLHLKCLLIPFTKATVDSLRSLVNLTYLEFDGNVGCCCEPAEEVLGIVDHHNNNNSGTPLLPIIGMPSNLEFLQITGFNDHVMRCRLLPAMKFDSSSRLNRLVFKGFGGVLLSGSLDLSNCQMLERLEIDRCNELREIADSGKLGSSWVSIDIWDCDSLEVLPNLSTMKRLKILNIGWCPKLREIKDLEVLTSLEQLEISGFPLLKVLPNFSSMKRLKILKIGQCPKLREIKGLEVLTYLKHLVIWYCPLLKKDDLHPDLLNSESLKIIFEYEDFEYETTTVKCLKMIQRMLLNRTSVSILFILGFLYIIHLLVNQADSN